MELTHRSKIHRFPSWSATHGRISNIGNDQAVFAVHFFEESSPSGPEHSGPFATGKLLKLNFEVSRSYFKESDHTWVFFSVSPLKPDSRVWKQMHAFRDSFRVKP